jgi:hypothetical protein
VTSLTVHSVLLNGIPYVFFSFQFALQYIRLNLTSNN